jgi:hypothetical protein
VVPHGGPKYEIAVAVYFPAAFGRQMQIDEITSLSPYGASTNAGGSGIRLK